MRTVLIDADIPAIAAAAVSESVFQFDYSDNPTATIQDDLKLKTYLDDFINEVCDAVEGDRVLVCLSDPEANWRIQLDPTYKANRKGKDKPAMTTAAKAYLGKEYPSFLRTRLEADDIMGILSTHPTLLPGEKVIVSKDKDMRTIPGLLYDPNKPDLGVVDMSPLDAARFHMWQTITGDATDNYPGCPGVGPKSVYAEEIVFAEPDEMWEIVLAAYASKCLPESAAIHQARLARILHARDYNMKTRGILLWAPEILQLLQ